MILKSAQVNPSQMGSSISSKMPLLSFMSQGYGNGWSLEMSVGACGCVRVGVKKGKES